VRKPSFGRESAMGADHILVRLGEGWISEWLTNGNEYNGVVAWQTGLDTSVHLVVDDEGPTRAIIYPIYRDCSR